MGLLSCASVVVITVLAELTFGDKVFPQKCCPGNQVLDVELRKCVDNPAVFKTYQEESGINDPLLQCSDGWETFKMENQSVDGAIVEPHFNQTITQYCVHSTAFNDVRNESVVAYCRTPAQVKKCCPMGQSVKRNSIMECIANDRVFNASKIVTPAGWPFKVVENSSLTCEYDFNIYVPKMFVDNRYEVNASGYFVVKRALYKVLRHSDNYCVDTAVDAEGNQEDIAMICLPWRMKLVRHLLWGVYSYLHYVSAFFLILTLAVYAIFPPLRDNIQGYSMICFLICMIIVQLEYGILLSLPTEPHTWCFFKSPRPSNRRDLLIRFALCSVYAWGLPFVLQMAVVIYRDSLGPPVRLCWFGNPIIKHLLSTPNVILVTANLIFFIPSALKVYGSLRFLKTSVSPVALSKLEKQRITTIFRFFLLMQFYTIPRIVHEIVDSDNATPELLIFSISLYMLIGPAMFYFFVCKTEVYKMIRDRVVKIKESASRATSNSTKISSGSVKFWRSRSYQTSSDESPAIETSDSKPSNIEAIKYQQNGEDNLAYTGEDHSA
ncbi:hypothetical protein DAPPUDRAFT_233474 [Daphnia pulex]|uniref:G-protein coupled receptors family 2 profile 2 domain-containing protein n=1 Tax=Daphnia pulex TaxID=6669 RepID=E9FU54_DAPPU|nr:hypothetical protein DAPPUDRAFT_233474 [Daphnia pulex]|eukprot:EFX89487.1 hypothetical protein DAPPUDRAFT_233474 [Daphnia pulex]